MNNCPCKYVSFADTVPLESLLRHVIPVVPELPHSMALDRLRQAFIDFSVRSQLIVGKLVQDYQADVCDYPLVPPEGYEVYKVKGLESPNYGFTWTEVGYGLWNTRFSIIDNSTIHIHSPPSVDQIDGLIVYVILVPTSCTNEIPSSVSTPFGNGIAQKVIADALRIPNKPWTSMTLARSYEMEYNRTVLRAKQISNTNRTTGPLRAKPVRIL